MRLWAESILLVLLGFTSLVVGLTNPWPAVAAAVVMFAAVLLRHWRPKLAAGLALVAGLMQLTQWTAFNPVADLGFAPICYQLAVQRDSSARRLGLLLAGLATACVAIVMPLRAPGPRTAADLVATGAALGAMGAVVAFGGWAGGFMRFQSRRAVEEQVAGRLAEADRRRLMDAYEQAQTRNRIAADMHDVVAHSWAVVAAQADGARYSLRTSPDRAEQALEVIGETARGAITDLRRILTQLRHAESDEGTIGPEQQQVVLDRMSASGMDLRFTETGERPTSSLLTLTAHRLLAESLTNALKHGDLVDGVAATRRLVDAFGDECPKVLVLTTFDLDESAAGAIEAGASGFVLKDTRPELLLETIRAVADGSQVMAAGATRRLFETLRSRSVRSTGPEYDALTPREREILVRAAQGMSNGEIAAAEFLSEATVKTHVSRILTKLQLRDRVQLVVYAYEHDLV